ncbi:MAG: FAD:protein FMN transferase [Actinobacteria bacterium]|nr:FAD:protein FMN transferase [Actinomycetota bacterium]
MDTVTRGLPAGLRWTLLDIGTATVGVAERDALGTSARVAAWPPYNLARVLAIVDTELARLDEQASRFRADSEISAVHRSARSVHILGEGLAEAIAVALTAAEWTGGLVDPTVGGALCALGYDRDFAAIRPGGAMPLASACVPGWESVRLDGRRLRLPAGSRLDLGATAKGLGSDRAANAAAAAMTVGGVLVSLGGDIAVAGESPSGGWPVLVADEQEPLSSVHARSRRVAPGAQRSAGQVVRLAAGALATSSVLCRQWRRGGQLLHHIVDPRTGRPAVGPWRTVSVAAANCAEANAASTAAIVAGDQAPAWLAGQGLPARLVARDGTVRFVCGWPEADGGLVEAPATCRMPAGPRGTGAPR